MKNYIVVLTTPKLDHVVRYSVEANSFGGADRLARKEYDWAKPLTVQAVYVDPNTPDADYEDKKSAVTLTNHQWCMLTSFLRMSTKYREGERDAWRRLSTEKNDDGTQTFKNAESNADFWEEMIQEIAGIQTVIDER